MNANAPERESGMAASKLDSVLLISATAAMAIAIGLLIYVITSQLGLYHSSVATELRRAPAVDHLAVLAYARSADYAASKYCSLLLGFALIFLGSAYVLRVSTVTYSLSAAAQGASGTFATTSPGLVMATLGVVLVALAVLTQSDVSLTYASHSPSPLHIVDDVSD